MVKTGKKTALLVVHGIGSQRPGESLGNCEKGLLLALPEAWVKDRAADRVVLRFGEQEVVLYEVYWADLLEGSRVEKSFRLTALDQTLWFPWLNWKSGLLARDEYSRRLVVARTAQLIVAGLGGSFLYQGTSALASLKTGWQRGHDSALNQIVADVWNYANSVQGALPADSPLLGVGEEIIGRFQAVVERARDEGCEELQVVAHSLGTVVLYHGLTRYTAPLSEPALPITRLYTIGSPLEKIRFLWPALLETKMERFEVQNGGRPIAAGQKVPWENFHSVFDLVSGRLKRFERWGVVNRHVWGLGGLATAHVNYFANPAVASRLAAGLTGHESNVGIGWLARVWVALKGTAEDLLMPIVLLLAFLVGLGVSILFGALLWLPVAGLIVWLAGLDRFWLARLCLGGGAIFVLLYVVFSLKDGYLWARRNHKLFWQAGRRTPATQGPPH